MDLQLTILQLVLLHDFFVSNSLSKLAEYLDLVNFEHVTNYFLQL